MPLRVERFDKSTHDRGAFDCGTVVLNEYLQKRAAQHVKSGVCKLYVLVEDSVPGRILGFYTLSNSEIARGDLDPRSARRLHRHPIPTITLGRIAVHRDEQGHGRGALLLVDAIQRCARVSQEVGVHAIIVDAKDDNARAFYEYFGFTALPMHPMRLILPMGTARQLLG